jgi:predicted O-methyltransferase YrrM
MKSMTFNKVPAALKYFRHKLVAGNAHAIHSPFVYELYNEVINNSKHYYAFNSIEKIRSKMLASDEIISVHDLGTGGKKNRQKKLAIKFIAKNYVKPAKYARLLFRLVNEFQPANILELGTSLGITTMYLASSFNNARVITIEGCPNTAAVAKKNFLNARIGNIEQIVGGFDEMLPEALKKIHALDFVYFDGNHTEKATLEYFHLCLEKHHEHSIFVFDDIHWSEEMSRAWKAIQQHPFVTLSVDLFSVGIVFFRKQAPKQHFILR